MTVFWHQWIALNNLTVNKFNSTGSSTFVNTIISRNKRKIPTSRALAASQSPLVNYCNLSVHCKIERFFEMWRLAMPVCDGCNLQIYCDCQRRPPHLLVATYVVVVVVDRRGMVAVHVLKYKSVFRIKVLKINITCPSQNISL